MPILVCITREKEHSDLRRYKLIGKKTTLTHHAEADTGSFDFAMVERFRLSPTERLRLI